MRETAVDDLLLEIITHPSELQDVGKMYIFRPENIFWHSLGEISTKGAFRGLTEPTGLKYSTIRN